MAQETSPTLADELGSPEPELLLLVDTVTALRTPVLARVRRELAVTAAEAALLARLAALGSLSMSKLAGELGATRPSVSKLVGQLELRDLVERRNDPIDRRTVHVSLTRNGLSRLSASLGSLVVCADNAIRTLDEDEREVVTRFLNSLVECGRAATEPA